MSSKNGYTVTCNLNQISLLASVSFTTLLAPKYGHQASQLSTVSRQSTKEFMRKSNAEKLNRMDVQSDKTRITFILLLILKICVCHPPPSNLDNGKKKLLHFLVSCPPCRASRALGEAFGISQKSSLFIYGSTGYGVLSPGIQNW